MAFRFVQSLFFILCFQMIQSAALSQQSYLYDLKCEHLPDPLGIDVTQPRFTWKQHDERTGAKLVSYTICVDTDSMKVTRSDGGAIWNSGLIRSTSNFATYKGRPLQPHTKYYWRVFATDQTGRLITSKPVASFETGHMHMKNWKGSWISDNNDINLKPAPYFRKAFSTSKKIRSARAYIAVAGLYELYINGKRIGNHRLDPMYTRFDRRVLYVTHDVTDQLLTGSNAIGVILGNGWYNHQSTAVWDFHDANWRARPTFCMDLRITFQDGSVETISTGKDWKTSLSPVIFNSIYTAEHFDARKEQPGWNTAPFNDSTWKNVIYRPAPAEKIVSQSLHPVRNVEKLKVKSLNRINDTNYVVDFGRNISGVTEITASGTAGTIIRLKHGERLYKNGHVDLSNIDVHYRPRDSSDPFQTDIFILSGKGKETFVPRFNYKGFQYVEIYSSSPINLNEDDLTAYFMHSDVPVAGTIKTSSELINKLWFATNNSYLSNLFGYPTDCPQREKNGWTGDAQIAIETGLYGFDGITVYEKWLADHRDEQQPNGVLPSIIPTAGWGYEWGNGPDWTSTIAIIPWNIYLFYGDDQLLRDCYDNIKRYVDHIDETYPSGLTSWGLGDWVPVKSKSPVELTSTAYYYADALILSKAAKLFNKVADQKKYETLANKIDKAFNEKYFKSDSMIYASGTQTELSVPLFWGLVPKEFKPKVAQQLALRVERDSFHLDVGLLGQKAILNALTENGYADVAYKVATQKTYPSWGWWIVNGATTLYENWNIESQYDISLNHIMFGEIGAWLYKGLGGIRPIESAPGFRSVLLTPYFPDDLQYNTTTHESPFGTIICSWKKNGHNIEYTVTIPSGSKATLAIAKPAGKNIYDTSGRRISAANQSMELSAGIHTLVIR